MWEFPDGIAAAISFATPQQYSEKKCFQTTVEGTGTLGEAVWRISLSNLEHGQQLEGLRAVTQVQLEIAAIFVQLRTLKPDASLQKLGLEEGIHPQI